MNGDNETHTTAAYLCFSSSNSPFVCFHCIFRAKNRRNSSLISFGFPIESCFASNEMHKMLLKQQMFPVNQLFFN